MAKKVVKAKSPASNLAAIYEPRWFIWTLVIAVVVLVGLATYITYGNIYDSQDSSNIIHHPTMMHDKTTNSKTTTNAPLKTVKSY